MKLIRIIAAALIAVMLTGACALADVVTTGNVNLRSGPGVSYSIITTIPKDTRLTYLGEECGGDGIADWYHVDYTGLQGWVSAKYAVYEPESEPIVIIPGASEVPTEMKAMEVAPFWGQGLAASAQYIGLNGYQETLGRVPKKYFDAYLTVAGNDKVELIALHGGAYTVFGVSIGMDISRAAVALDSAGMDYVTVENGNIVFAHTGANGEYDSEMILKVVNNSVISIEWAQIER